MSNVAPPCIVGTREQHDTGDGPLTIINVAIEQVNGEATAGIESLLYCRVARA